MDLNTDCLLEDDIGQKFDFTTRPQRIISLVPSITCSIIELGAKDLLVGRTKFCIYPDPDVKDIPTVGGTKQVHIDTIKELHPDLVICNQEENTKEIFDSLKKLSIPTFVTNTKNLEDNQRLIFQLGAILNTTELAPSFHQKIEDSFSSIKNLFQNKSVLYLIWKNPYMSIGGDTFIHSVLENIGLINCFSKQKRYPTLEPNEIASLQVDYIFLSSEPYPFNDQHIQEFKDLSPSSKVILVQGEYFSWHGTMMSRAAEYFIQLQKEI